ncbi:hypothetical protein, partial [Pyxidicoccus trucidator]|uniref:hypothetical protein n=1 Tax=Pyxidicoccus trucidator TaxID=2709662 RepID=UPI001967EB96
IFFTICCLKTSEYGTACLPVLAPWAVSPQRVSRGDIFPDTGGNVLLKLARGHAMFELDMPLEEDGGRVEWTPLALMDAEAQVRFETPPTSSLFPEVGSRAMQRVMVVSVTLASLDDPTSKVVQESLWGPGWIEVQPGRYRYLATVVDSGHVIVRMVLSEYLACEVIWSQE